jgi:hypothetical protein
MDVVAHNPDFHDSHVVTPGDLWQYPPEKRGRLLMDERQSPQRRPGQQTIEPHRHGPQNRI